MAASAWALTPPQSDVIQQVVQALESGVRHGFMVTGDPGSGKTVIALNLIKEAFARRLAAVYATGNDGLRNVVRESMGI